MANQPPRSGASKDKDDDSWGKLASDLFGIQFAKPDDDDFDLPDDESPLATAPQPEVKSGPTLADVVPVTEAAGSNFEEEPDLSFPEEDEPAVATPKPVVKSKTAPPKKEVNEVVVEENEADEDASVHSKPDTEKDIWDLLETWNWDEAPRDSNRGRSTQDSLPAEGGRSSGPRSIDHDSRRERFPERSGERAGRSRSSETTPAGENTRETRPRREDRPRRTGTHERDRQRSEPHAPEPRPVETRPARSEGSNRRPPHSVTPKDPAGLSDEFATGLDEEAIRSQPVRERGRPAARRPSPPPRTPAPPVDDFDGDLFAELEATQSDEGADAAEDSEESAAETQAGEERRRRRRRRRRGVRNRRDEYAPATSETDESTEDVVQSADDESLAAEPEESVEGSSDLGEREPRRRRRRRRVRRRDDETVEQTEMDATTGEVDESSVLEEDSTDEESFETDEESVESDEEPVVAVSYEGIPSWEEAISYLQRRPRESRPRGDGPSRGRGGSHRR